MRIAAIMVERLIMAGGGTFCKLAGSAFEISGNQILCFYDCFFLENYGILVSTYLYFQWLSLLAMAIIKTIIVSKTKRNQFKTLTQVSSVMCCQHKFSYALTVFLDTENLMYLRTEIGR